MRNRYALDRTDDTAATQNATATRQGANRTRRKIQGLMVFALVGGVGGSLALNKWQQGRARPLRVYTSEGLGGWVAPIPADKVRAAEQARANDPLRPLREDYQAGRWTDVESKAEAMMQARQFSPDNAERRQAAQAQLMAAYASAWRKDYPLAATRFRTVQTLASELPDHGAAVQRLGELNATLEEEAALQHAVCISAEGDTRAAEAEYDGFLRQYPQSVLVHAAIKRIARLHKGDVPKDAEALWTAAMKQQKQANDAKRRDASLCGPECLAELLHRQGKPADAHALATEMQTSADGTTLANLTQTAQKHGIAARGLMLTPHGLAKQSFPVIALLAPGHYVLAQGVDASGTVTAWDPDLGGVGQGGAKTYRADAWRQAWTGMTLAVK